MKKFTKLLGIVLIIALVMSMGTAAFATTYTTTKASDGSSSTVETTESFKLDIGLGNTNPSVEHTYEAYQVFDGDLLIEIDQTVSPEKTTKTLSNIVWGSSISNPAALVTELKANSIFASIPDYDATNDKSAAAVAEILGKNTSFDAANAQTFADLVSAFLGTPAGTSTAAKSGDPATITGYSIKNLTAGYYLIKDKDDQMDDEHDFNTRFMLEVIADVSAQPKGDYPTLDKQVQDDEAEDTSVAAGWSDAADHELYESFKFKLSAFIPASADIGKYDTYKVIFTDTMSKGITFESIDTVTVGGTYASASGGGLSSKPSASSMPVNKVVPITDYTLAGIANGDNGDKTWTLTIDNLKTVAPGMLLTDDIFVEVIYNAHLNEDAKAFNTNTNNDNSMANNKAKLKYSNNPNADGDGDFGETPEDTVWVFTYKVDNTKYKTEKKDGNKFGGAGFTLYEKKVVDGTETEVRLPLIYDTQKKAYRPLKDDNEIAGYTFDGTKTGEAAFTKATASTLTTDIKADMVSADADGLFNIIGLDEGVYVLKETATPTGYNTCDPITITISAKTTENVSTAGADLVLEGSATNPNNMTNDVINNSGTVLPSTGGIGTTIFYVVGSILVVAAGVLLITKKRMSREG